MNNRDNIRPSAEGDETSEIEESVALGGDDSEAGMGTVAEEDEAALDIEAVIEASAENKKVVKLLPLHAVPGTQVVRRVGRPRKIERKPNQTDLEYHQEMSKEKADFIETDPVVAATRDRADAADMLRLIKEHVAREAAALHFQRIENEKYGKDTAQVSSRRIEALKKIADIELEIKKMGADTVNLKSEKFQRVFKYLIMSFREVCLEIGLRPEQIDLLFNRLSTSMEGWEDKAAELVR